MTGPTASMSRGSDTPTRQLLAIRPMADAVITVGPYELRRLIGTGGMGAVWEAMDTRLQRKVALKMMLADAKSERNAERFRREAMAAARLRHPGIVQVHEYGEDAGRMYIAMDLIAGPSLSQALRSAASSYEERARVLLAVAEAVAYAHEQGIVHRDIKPSNILLEHDDGNALGRPMISDFGLAKSLSDVSDLTRSGEPLGTYGYMPPEQALGRQDQVGPCSDIYSLGAVLYEELTGRAPFTGANTVVVAREVVEKDPVPPRVLTPDVPRDLEIICLTCLAKSPRRRYPTAAALARDLRSWLNGEAIVARAPSLAERFVRHVRRHAQVWAVASAAALLLIAVTGWYVHSLAVRSRQAEAARQRAEELLASLVAENRARSSLESERSRTWTEVFRDSFADGRADERWRITARAWSHVDGGLRTEGPGLQALLLKLPVAGDIRLSFTCRVEGPDLNDVSCRMALPRDDPEGNMFRKGYGFDYGAWGNSRNSLTRKGQLLWQQEDRPLSGGRSYRAVAERIGARLAYTIDGKPVFSVEDPQPLSDHDHCRVALYGYSTRTTWSDVVVERLGEPQAADILEVAERRLQERSLATSHELFSEVLATSNDGRRREAAERGIAAVATQRQAEQALADMRLAILAAWPGATVVCEDGGLRVDAHDLGISDAKPLTGLPVHELDLGGNAISDLRPLAGLPLRKLTIASNPIADLEPLHGMPLKSLNLINSQVRDLRPLAGLPLGELLMLDMDCPDLSPLAGMPLDILFAGSCHIVDLSPLRGMRLRMLAIPDNRIADLTPLAGMPLRILNASGNRIRDLAPLAGMPLSGLNLAGNPLADPGLLARSPTEQLLFESPQLPEAFLDALQQAWNGRSDCSRQLRQLGILRLLRAQDAAGLKLAASVRNGNRYLYVPRTLTWDEARIQAETLGGRLAMVRSADDLEFLDALTNDDACWLGGRSVDGQLRWLDGRPAHIPDSRPAPQAKGMYLTLSKRRLSPQLETATCVPRLAFLMEWPENR
jgi:hypothetical protein